MYLKYPTLEHKLKELEKTAGNAYYLINSISLPALVIVSVRCPQLKFKQLQ